MNNDVIFSNRYAELIYQADDSLLIVRLKGFQKPERAAQENLILMETIRQKRVRSVVINQRDIKVLSQQMQSWIVDNASVMLNSGVMRMAVVLPEDVFALAAISKIHGDAKLKGIENKLFNSEEEALKWLRS